MPLSPMFRPVDFAALPGWDDDAMRHAFKAFQLSAVHALTTPYKTGAAGVEAAAFREAFAEAVSFGPLDDADARGFFERHFLPCHIALDVGSSGFVTSFYEPQVEASAVRTDRYTVPLLGTPTDIVKIDDTNRPSGFDPYLAFGRMTPQGIVGYPDRAAIEKGAIEGLAQPIAWLADPVDAFFIHVQGAARLIMPGGEVKRVTYAAKSGHRFTGPGALLAQLGEIPREEVTMQAIRGWFAANPHRVEELLHQNRSYIFFRVAEVDDSGLGPVAAAKVPLVPGRSVAIDKSIHTFATPFFIHAPEVLSFEGKPFRRLMIAQDTGSAIVGPARGDLFAGSGDAAGEVAGVVRHPAEFYPLVPRVLIGGAST